MLLQKVNSRQVDSEVDLSACVYPGTHGRVSHVTSSHWPNGEKRRQDQKTFVLENDREHDWSAVNIAILQKD